MSYPLTFSLRLSLPSRLAVLAFFLLLALDVSHPSPAHGQSAFEWTNTSSVNRFWDISGNWSPSGPPGASDTAVFNLNATYTVSWDSITANSNPSVGFVDVLGGNVTWSNEISNPVAFSVNGVLSLSGADTRLTNRGLDLTVGGATNIVNGAQLIIDGNDPAGSRFQSTNTFLTQGLLAFNSGATGIFSGPLEININNSNAATMNVLSGSQLVANGNILIGTGNSQAASSSGTLVVNGANTKLTMGNGTEQRIGNSAGLGSHSVTVSGGGTLATDVANGATILVDQSGSLNVTGGGILQSRRTTVLGLLSVESGGLVKVGRDLDVLGGNLAILSGGKVESQLAAAFQSSIDGSQVLISGTGSEWNVGGPLTIGGFTPSNLHIESGGALLVNETTSLGAGSQALVTGAGSVWDASEFQVFGSLNIENQGGVGVTQLFKVDQAGAVTISGSGSSVQSGRIEVGGLAAGTASLEVLAGGEVQALNLITIGGSLSTTNGNIRVAGVGSKLTSANQLSVGLFGDGNLVVEDGGRVTNGFGNVGSGTIFGAGRGSALVQGAGSRWESSSLTVGDHGEGFLQVRDQAVVRSNNNIRIGNGRSAFGDVDVRDAGSQMIAGGAITLSNGTLSILNGGLVTSERITDFPGSYSGSVGQTSSSTGLVTVQGAGSRWINNGELWVGQSVGTSGTVNIESGGRVSTTEAFLGRFNTATGNVHVTGDGSALSSSGSLHVGYGGVGQLAIDDQGLVENVDGVIGNQSTGSGVVTVLGPGSMWRNTNDLQVGLAGTGTLNIFDQGLVNVGNETRIGSQGSINLAGGRFEFGVISRGDLARVNATSGSMAGIVNLSGINQLNDFPALQNPAVDLTGIQLNNHGLLVGSAILGSSLTNQTGGELMTVAGQHAIFAGALDNHGEINNAGGIVRFEQAVTNQAGAFVGGRGLLGAGDGWINEGVMAFSGNTDILGDVVNEAGGQIVTSGGATTTFFDDVVHNGTEIRTSAGSSTVIFGVASGSGSYTGTGTVFFEGDLRPGNSPDIVSFDGNVVLGSNAHTFIEIGGFGSGLFDQLVIAGDLSIDGLLSINLINGYILGPNQQYFVGDIGGSLTGQFIGLSEGALIGNFDGHELFITYNGFGGSVGIGLFTAVPEPGSASLLGCLMLGVAATLRLPRGQGRNGSAPVLRS